ncbi:MAG: hypothetical protein AAGG48_06820 [Planctomycetota bacterium]
MGIFDKMFGTKKNDDELDSMPWDERPSIYEHVRLHVDSSQSGLTEGGETLPDDERVNAESQIRWAAGAMDGVATHHMGGGDVDDQVRKTVGLVLTYCGQPTAANKAALYNDIIEENTVSIIDHVIEAITSEERIEHQRLYDLAYSFVTEAPDREPTKFGIAILGLFGEAGNEELFQTLGRHDEFTLFCAVALANSSEDTNRSLWTLARNVDGWGRIQVVERLAQTDDAEIKAWLLREGYRNSVMYEYLAYTCATAGGLLSALSEDDVDRELLTSAGEILQALIAGGPAECIDDYDDGALVAELFVGHIADAADTIADFLHVSAIKEFLSDDDADWGARTERGWDSERRSRLLETCEGILSKSEWKERVGTALLSNDEMEFRQASQAATSMGIETWGHHWRRWQAKPNDAGRWFQVVWKVDEERLPTVLQAAEDSIDLTVVATGPSDELGLGPGYDHHSSLGYLLQELRRFPGQGATFIEAGLKSPVVRNRNMAVNALAEWQADQRHGSPFDALQSAAKIEPNDDVKERMTKVLNGESLEA